MTVLGSVLTMTIRKRVNLSTAEPYRLFGFFVKILLGMYVLHMITLSCRWL